MSLNKVLLIGRLGQAPIVRYMPNGDAVCNFSLATSEKFTDKSGNKAEKTEWHNIVIYRKLAEIAGQYLKKGSQVYLEGRIQSRKYTDKNGVERTAYEIVCDEMKMLDSKNTQGGHTQAYDAPPAYNSQPQQAYAAPQPAPVPPAPPQRQEATPVAPAQPIDNIDEDIPF